MDWPLMGQPCNVFGQEPNSFCARTIAYKSARNRPQNLNAAATDAGSWHGTEKVIKKGD